MRRFAVLALLLPALLLLLAAPAQADDRVAEVPDAMLPVAWTCAPLEVEEQTVVWAGTPGDSSWFRVEGITGVMDIRGLEALLAQRSGVQEGTGVSSRHPVWIRVSAAHRWEHIVRVMLACLRAGIYRVGLLVRHPEAAGVYALPLFLPGPLPGVSVPQGKATGVEIRVGTSLIEGAPVGSPSAPSDPGRLLAAARRISERYPERAVASLRVAHNAPVQYSVTTLDMLYRGGVAGVKLRFPMLKGSLNVEVRPWLMVESLMLDSEPLGVEAAPVSPRATPWPDSGANVPGVLLMETEDVSTGVESEGTTRESATDWPSHGPTQVPPRLLQHATTYVSNFAQGLSVALLRGIQGGPEVVAYLSERLRPLAEFTQVMAPLRSAFPDAQSVTATALQVDVLLYREGRCVGNVEATLDLSTSELGLVFLRPGRGELGGLAPSPQDDPSRAGVPGAIRVLLEDALATLGAHGQGALKLRSIDAVLAQLPTVAHGSVRPALERRPAELGAVLALLRSTPYDRLLVRPLSASAAVRAGDAVVGVLSMGTTVEEMELRISGVTARRAPR